MFRHGQLTSNVSTGLSEIPEVLKSFVIPENVY